MRIKSEKARLKAIERRAKWFEKMAKEEPLMGWAKGKIDKYFVDDEYANAYAMFLDLVTNNYPFVETSTDKDVIDVVREKYGFDWIEIDIMIDMIDDAAKKFPNEFDSQSGKDYDQ